MDHNNKFLMRLIFCISFILVFGVKTQTAVAYQAYTHNAITDKVDELFKQWDKGIARFNEKKKDFTGCFLLATP